MDIAYEIARYLSDSDFGTLGTDIFVGQLPADTEGLYVYRVGGNNHEYLPLERPVLDVYCVKSQAIDCVQTLEGIKRHIHRMFDTETNNTFIYSLLVFGDIEDVDRDLEYKKVFKISIELIIRDKGMIS